jgi:hypothetical protein
LYDELIDRCIDGSIQSIEERTEKFQTPNSLLKNFPNNVLDS